MSEVVYRSEVRIERVNGPVRKAYLPAESEPVIFGVHGAVAARQIGASAGRLVGEAVGEIELEGSVLVIRRIHVRLILKCEDANRDTATRLHGIFADKCPVYVSLKAAITMTTELVFN